MADKVHQSHRAGVFKQTNKAHKHGRHRSKGCIDVAAKGIFNCCYKLVSTFIYYLILGKLSVKALTKRQKRDLNKDQRRHQANQLRQNKRDEILNKKRSLGGSNNAPFLGRILNIACIFCILFYVFQSAYCLFINKLIR